MSSISLPEEIAALERRLCATCGDFVTLATAESATGGRIADRLTEIPGSSHYFLGGIVAYSNEAKQTLLGVNHDTLIRYGAVSPEVASEMADGARRATGARVAISDTGIAGPGGATESKPVGLFYLGLSTPDGCSARKAVFSGDRTSTKERATEAALTALRDYLLQCCDEVGANEHGSL